MVTGSDRVIIFKNLNMFDDRVTDVECLSQGGMRSERAMESGLVCTDLAEGLRMGGIQVLCHCIKA